MTGTRREFEEWYAADAMPAEADWFKRDWEDPDEYDSGTTHCAWKAWQAAIKHEREACATICEELHEHYSGYKDTALLNGDVELSNAASGEPRACETIAAAIRARD